MLNCAPVTSLWLSAIRSRKPYRRTIPRILCEDPRRSGKECIYLPQKPQTLSQNEISQEQTSNVFPITSRSAGANFNRTSYNLA